MQRRINFYLKTLITGSTKYAAANAQGLSAPNIYSRSIATITKYFIQGMLAKTGYSRKITEIYKYVFGYEPKDRLICGTKGLTTIINSFKLLGLNRLANSAKTYSNFLIKSTNYTGHILIFGSNQDKNLFNQPTCLRNLKANFYQFSPSNSRCHLIRDFTD